MDNGQLVLCLKKQCSAAAGNRAYYRISVNRTNSNMFLGHQQDHPWTVYMSLYLLATYLKFLALCVSIRLSFPLGSTFLNCKMSIFLRTADLQYNTAHSHSRTCNGLYSLAVLCCRSAVQTSLEHCFLLLLV